MPLVLFGYYNPIHAYGPERFAREAARAGVDGVLVVDLPFEEAEELRRYTDPAGISFITLVAPTTGEERARKVVACIGLSLLHLGHGGDGHAGPRVGGNEQERRGDPCSDETPRRRRIRCFHTRAGPPDRQCGRRCCRRERLRETHRRESRQPRSGRRPGGLRRLPQGGPALRPGLTGVRKPCRLQGISDID